MTSRWPPLGHFVDLPWAGGIRTFVLTPEQARRYSQAPHEVVVELVGCSVADFDDWRASRGRIRCRGTTATGRPCQNYVTGLVLHEPSEHAGHPGGYCSSHDPR